MNKSIYILQAFILTGIIIGCGSTSKKEATEATNEPEKIVEKSSQNDEKSGQSYHKVVNNDFARSPFKVPMELNQIEKFNIDFTRSLKVVENTHNDGKDTVYRFSYEESYFEFYKSSQRTFFQKAVIKDKEINIDYISIGMLKSDFLELMALDEINESIIVVTDDEEYAWHTFTFKSDELIQVVLNMNVD